jgi:hypothetical protein
MTAMKTIHNVTGPQLTIDLPPEFKDHQVEVEVRILEKKQECGDGLRRYAGVLDSVWTDEDDQILPTIHEDRKRLSRRDVPE